MLVETKKEYVKEKEALIAAKKKYENELAKLEEERAQAVQELENQRAVTKKLEKRSVYNCKTNESC